MNKYLEEYNPNIELIGSGNTDYGHNLADIILRRRRENEKLGPKGVSSGVKLAEFENYISFVKAIKNSGININDEFSDRYEKEKLIRKYTNYTKLNGFGKEKRLLKDCSDHKIGSAFKNIYNSALKKIQEGK